MQRLENEKNLTLDPISYKDKRSNEILTPYIRFSTLSFLPLGQDWPEGIAIGAVRGGVVGGRCVLMFSWKP